MPGKKALHAFHFADPPLCRSRGSSRAIPGTWPTPGDGFPLQRRRPYSQTERNSDDAERDSRDVSYLLSCWSSLNPPVPKLRGPNNGCAELWVLRGRSGAGDERPRAGVGLERRFLPIVASRAELTGRRTKRVFKLGDRLDVQVAKVDTSSAKWISSWQVR